MIPPFLSGVVVGGGGGQNVTWVTETLSEAANKFSRWCSLNGLTLNYKKSTTINIFPSKAKNPRHRQVNLFGLKIFIQV